MGHFDIGNLESAERFLNKGAPLEKLTELVDSNNSDTSTAGAFLIEELNHRNLIIKEHSIKLLPTSLKLSRSPDAWKRKVAIEFFMKFYFINDDVLRAVCINLNDTDVNVRSWAIHYMLILKKKTFLEAAAIVLGKQYLDFENFLVDISYVSKINRAARALRIAAMMKTRVDVDTIFFEVGMEDSFTYEAMKSIAVRRLENRRDLPASNRGDR